MKIIKAKTAGFCFGVANAVEKSFDILRNKQENAVVFSYGELIHNDHVIHRLTELGMRVIHDVDEIIVQTEGHPERAVVIIRAHGVSRKIFETLEQMRCTVIDATCPFVTKIHTCLLYTSPSPRDA